MGRAPEGPVTGLLGRLVSRAYGWEIARRNRRYDAGRGVVRFDRPVISVGNLSVGGTGKTPMVAHIVGTLLDAGRRPCIAMRGYAPGGGESDEAEEYRRRFPAVPVVARPDRAHGLVELFATEAGGHVDCVVLDDGFQHRRIARDLDLVLIDATRSPFEDALLPAGWLREPVESLRRSSMVVVSHAEAADPAAIAALGDAIERVRGRGPEAVARHAWAGLMIGDDQKPLTELRGKRVLAVCAIGNPPAFVAEARRTVGGALAGEIVLRDHDPYGAATVQRIISGARAANAEIVLTTEKDWSKLAAVTGWPCPVARPLLRLAFDRGDEALRTAIISAVESVRDEPGNR